MLAKVKSAKRGLMKELHYKRGQIKYPHLIGPHQNHVQIKCQLLYDDHTEIVITPVGGYNSWTSSLLL